MLSHGSLENYYETTFAMLHHYHYNLSDLENMYPYERDIYVLMIANHNRKMAEKNG